MERTSSISMCNSLHVIVLSSGKVNSAYDISKSQMSWKIYCSILCCRLIIDKYNFFHNFLLDGDSQGIQRFDGASYRRVDGNWCVALEEGYGGKRGGDQADPLSSPQAELCVNGHGGQSVEDNSDLLNVPSPGANLDDVESVRSFNIRNSS